MIEFKDKYGSVITTNQGNITIKDYKRDSIVEIIGTKSMFKVSQETIEDILLQIKKEEDKDGDFLLSTMPGVLVQVLQEVKKGQNIDKKVQHIERRDYLTYLDKKSGLSESEAKEFDYLNWWVPNKRWEHYE